MKTLAEMHAADYSAAEAAIAIARANGFDNVELADSEGIDWVGEVLGVSFGVVWLDTLADEKPALALLNSDVWQRCDLGETEGRTANLLWSLDYDTRRVQEFARLFVC